ncbi:MAG TPA: lamin tail domain-containing protein, partial [candidate division Zixibacteria bacterium]|nr:lamin tail domain-containing protein [candidate division Zixibacteria bacterium]
MSKRIIVAVIAILLIIWGTSFTEIKQPPKFSKFVAPVALVSPDLNRSRAVCSIQKHDDTALGFYSGFDTNDRIVTYFDFAAECGASPYPFEIQSLTFTFIAPTAAYQWPIEVDVVVYDLAGADSCGGPGIELCRFSVTCDSAVFRLPHIGTANFPGPCCVNGPVYIGLEYTDTDPGTFPSVVFDKSAPVPMCENWGYSVGSWFEWYSFWGAPQPGYPIYWVEGETQSSVCDGRVVINEICPSPGETGRSFELLEHEWVEIHNAGYASIDLAGWTISNNDGTASISLPAWDLPPGCFLQIHQKSGANDNDFDDLDGHYYTGNTSEIFDDGEDECALYSGAPSVVTVVDFVSWSSDGSYSPGSAHGMAVAGGIWTSGDFVNASALVSPDCISRYFDGFDRDESGDWRIISWTLYAQNIALQPENPIQELPKNRAVISDATPTFDWADFPDADEYDLQVDNNWDFSSPEINVSGLNTSEYTALSALPDDGYFWRVRSIDAGTPTPWAAEWLFVVETSRSLRGASGQLPAPHKWQRKDTQLLCLWEQRASTRPGCVETGTHAWDVAHPNQSPPGCPHDNWYCARASVAMVNAKYGGDLSQDRISYHVCSPLRAQPEGDYGHNIGLSDAQVTTALSWALNGAAINYQLVAAGSFTFAQIKGWIDSLDCFVAAVPGHCLVIDDYFEFNTPGGTNI